MAIKLVIANKGLVDSALQAYLDALHESVHKSRVHKVNQSFQQMAQAINLHDAILPLLPTYINVLTLIPSGGLELFPLHALPLCTEGKESVADSFDVRYVSSLTMLHISHMQESETIKRTPMYYSHMCVLEVSEGVGLIYI